MRTLGAGLVVLGCVALSSAQDLSRDRGALIFANQAIALRFDAATGSLSAAGPVDGLPVVTSAPADIRIGQQGKWLGEQRWKLTDAHVDTGRDDPTPPPWMVGDPAAITTGAALTLTMESGDWQRIDRWRMWPNEPFVARTVTWIWHGQGTVRIDGTRLHLGGVTLPGSELVFPAEFPVASGPMRDGPIPRGSQNNQLAVVQNGERAVLALVDGVAEPVGGYVSNGDIIHQFGTQLVAQPNQPFEVGAQVLALSGSGPPAVAEVTHRVHDRFGLRTPIDTPDIEKTVLYSAHAGGTIDSGFRDTGGFVAMTQRLPHLRELGFNCLWLLPFWKGSVYAPSDYYALDPSLGTEADLKALVDEAHRLGIKVLGDLIPHGPKEESGLLQQHPDAVTYNEDGSVKYMWGCLQCDYAQPEWQTYMADHAVYWMKQVGLDGYRVDVAFGGAPNWKPAAGVRPSMSQAYGARKLLATVRAAMKAQDPNSLLLMEGTAPGLCESGDIVYDFPWTYSVLPRSVDMPGEEWVPAAKEWLVWQTALYPRGARFLRYVSSHDTVRGLWKYGPAHHRVLLAINACLPGVPMVYDDEEMGQTCLGLWKERDPATVTWPTSEPAAWAFYRPNLHRIMIDERFMICSLADRTTECSMEWEGQPWSFTVRPGLVGNLLTDSITFIDPRIPPHRLDWQRTDEGVVVHAQWYEIAFEPQHGGAIRWLKVGQRYSPITAPSGLREGRRKLRIGQPAGDLLDWSAEPVVERIDDRLRVTFSSAAMDGLTVERAYDCGAYEVSVSTELRFADGLQNVNASLVERLPCAGDGWVVETAEGFLAGSRDELRTKRTSGEGYRYRHAAAPAWSHRQFPLVGQLGVMESGVHNGPRSTSFSAVRIADLAADPPTWLQDITIDSDGIAIHWLAERWPVTIAPGAAARLQYRLAFTLSDPSETRLGPLHITENPHYRLAVDRSSGGSITELRRRTTAGFGPSLIEGLTSYTDHGIYGPWRDPTGVERPTNAQSAHDIEPAVSLNLRGGLGTTLIEGTMRSPYGDGLHVAKPYTWYRHGVTTDDTNAFELRLGLRIPGGFESGDTPIFAAHILRLREVRNVTIEAGGKTTTHEASEKDAGRVWQSLAAGALPDSITVEAAGGTMVLTPVSGAESLQNIFLYDGGGGRMTLFFAPFDLQPEKALPIWKESRWRVALQP